MPKDRSLIRELLSTESADELQAVEQSVSEHRRLTRQLRDAENGLVESGDGLGIEALKAEAGEAERLDDAAARILVRE